MHFIFVIVVIFFVGCGEADPKTGPPTNNVNNTNNANNTNNVNNSNNVNNTNNNTINNGTPSADFLAVASLWTQTCAAIACHGAASNNVISAAANENASPAEVYAALMTDTPTADGLRAIEPFDPASSDVIVRMSLQPTGDLREMPQGTGSPMEDIEVFTTWINNGANF